MALAIRSMHFTSAPRRMSFQCPSGAIVTLSFAISIIDVQFCARILIFSTPMFTAMSFEFHRNHYRSPYEAWKEDDEEGKR